jgi:hypothetical protein
MEIGHAEQLAERLDRLDLENQRLTRAIRRLKLVVGALVLVCSVPVAMGAYQVSVQKLDLITAHQLTILDRETNKPRITLGVGPQKQAFIHVDDQEGNAHIRLWSDWKGEVDGLEFLNTDGKQRVWIGANGNTQGVFVNGKLLQ